MQVINWVIENQVALISVVTSVIGVASIVVKLTPTLKDDNILKGVIKFLGKFIALNR